MNTAHIKTAIRNCNKLMAGVITEILDGQDKGEDVADLLEILAEYQLKQAANRADLREAAAAEHAASWAGRE